MKKIETKLPGVFIVEPHLFNDSRGWFMESYRKAYFDCEFVQDNHSYSAMKGTLRGIHFQSPPMAQAKLVRCVRGAVMDYAVDLRTSSTEYKKWIGVELSENNKRQLFIPRGFGHAFIALEDDTQVLYKADNYYSPEHDRSIIWSDPDIAIKWAMANPILSEKDQCAPRLKDLQL